MAEVERGEVWWADLPEPRGSEPGYRRPVLIAQSNVFNESRIATVVVVMITSNLRLADAPGNVFVRAGTAGLDRDSVVNVSQVVTLDRVYLSELCGRVPAACLRAVEEGLRMVLGL